MNALFSRLTVLWLSGFLMGSGWINEEIQQMLLTDPAITDALQVSISAIAAGIWLGMWRLAKRFGWAT
jgi:hypothetical protein